MSCYMVPLYHQLYFSNRTNSDNGPLRLDFVSNKLVCNWVLLVVLKNVIIEINLEK